MNFWPSIRQRYSGRDVCAMVNSTTMSRSRSQKEPQLVADILFSVLKQKKTALGSQFIRWRLWNEWKDVVGAEIASHTVPVQFIRGELYVWVKSAARMQDLIFLVQPLREKINRFAGQNWVKYIRFTLDRRSVPMPEETESGLREFLAKTAPNEDEGPPRDP